MTVKLAGTKYRLGAEFAIRNANEIGLSGAVDVRAFGASPAETGAVNAAAIRQAAMAARGGTLKIPAGQFAVDTTSGPIVLEEVAIVGAGVLDGATAAIDQGTVFQVTATGASLFKVRRGVSISGCGFFYPDQTDSATPVAYPPTIDFDFDNGPVQFVRLTNNVVYNAYRWVRIGDANGNVGHVWIADNTVYGIHRCIEVTHNLEVIKISGNTFTFGHWLAATEGGCRAYTRANGVAIEYNRGDGIFLTENLFFGYLKGLAVSSGGTVALCRISDNSFDQSRFGIYASGAGNFTTSQIVGNDFNPFNGIDTTQAGSAIYVATSGAVGETLVIDGNVISSPTEDGILISGNTPTRWVVVSNNVFASWARDKTAGTYYAINVSGAATNLIAQGNLLAGSGTARTSGIGGSCNTIAATGNVFNACQNAINASANFVTHNGNTSFATVSSASDVISAATIQDLGNAYDKSTGNTTRAAFLARKNAAQTFNSGAATDVSFVTEVYDRGGVFESPSFTAPKTGRYSFDYSLFHDNAGTAGDRWTITLVSSGSGALQRSYLMIADYNSVSGSGQLQLTAGETVKLQVARVGGAGNFVTFNDANANWFSGSLIE